MDSKVVTVSEGDRVTFSLKGVVTNGTIMKKNGVRLRIEHDKGSCWAEVKDIQGILPKVRSGSVAEKWPPGAVKDPAEVSSPSEKVRKDRHFNF